MIFGIPLTYKEDMPMPAPRNEPYTKVCITLPDEMLERLRQYPGEQSWKIEMLCRYALDLGALMSPEEARKLAEERAMKILRSAGSDILTENKKRKK